jgi:glycosyltransferase involved in cell wall biosynthesis
MRVLLLTPSVSARMGGSITGIVALAKVLSRDLSVDVWTTDHDLRYVDPTLGGICNLRVFRMVSERFFLAPGMLPALVREGNTFDVINVFHFWTIAGLLGGLIAPSLQCPVHIHTQGMFLPVALRHHGARKRFAQLLGGRYLLNRFTEIVACNAAEVSHLREWGSQKPIHVLPNAVFPLTAERGLLRSRLGLSDDIRIVAYLNRFDPIKRVVDLCRAFRLVQDRLSDVVFLLAGDAATPYGREVQAYAQGVGLRARFLGYLGPQEKWNLLADADVLCQYSAQEAHSIALTEAIAAGVPVVVSRECNFEQIGTEGAGVIVDSIEEMADATTRLLADAGLRRGMSANALRLAQNYTPEAVAATFLSIIRECRSGVPAATTHIKS